MNPKLDLLFGRRSIRKFESGDLPDDLVRDLLEAGMAAPSACEDDPWRFVVVREQATLERIAEGLPHGRLVAKAGAAIVVAGDLDAAHDRQLSYLLQDCSACIENILLAAYAVGLGACWLGVHPREPRVEHLRELLSLPAQVLPVCVIAVGWPGERKEPRTRYDEAKIHRERW